MQRTRVHHFQMKYLLVQMALQSPAEFFERFKPGGDANYLPDLWTALGLELEKAERVPNTGAATWHRPPQNGGAETLVLILPQPQTPNEAYFIGAWRLTKNAWRVFCLEHSKSNGTVLTEFAANGRMNWGRGSRPALADFVTLMDEVASDPDAKPDTFVEMKLG